MLYTIKKSWLFIAIILFLTSQAFGHGMSEEEKQTIIEGRNLRYI